MRDSAQFGPIENNPIPEGYHEQVTDQIQRTVSWTEPGLKIVRLRFLSDPGYPRWDVSYCHGQLPSGEYVDVELPFHQLLKWGVRINDQIVEFARRDRIYAKNLGIFDAISTLN